MGFWRRWLARLAGRHVTNPEFAANPRQDSRGRATCSFCGSDVLEQSSAAVAYPVWRCKCGAIGSGSLMYPDLDEVADKLLAIADISGSVSEPSISTRSNGMLSVQHYDISKSLNQLGEILRAHDFEMQTNSWKESSDAIHAIWIRRRIA